MNILILGHNGMLGHMLVKYLEYKNCNITTTNHRFPTNAFKDEISNFKGDYIINAIGSIPQKTNAFSINYELPIWLDVNSNIKIIHAGTDCEIDVDEYGISKRIAREYIINSARNTKIIKTSIIGPELKGKYSLMEWVLSQPNESVINGFSEFYWNGNTTLTWSKFCFELMNGWDEFYKETVIFSDCISKYDLLKTITNVFGKKIKIKKLTEPKKNKCLTGDIQTNNIKQQLIELKNFMELSKTNEKSSNNYLA